MFVILKILVDTAHMCAYSILVSSHIRSIFVKRNDFDTLSLEFDIIMNIYVEIVYFK